MFQMRKLMNPNIKDKESIIRVHEDVYLKDVDLQGIQKEFHEYINIVDDDDNVVGAIKTERLKFLVNKQNDTAFMHILDNLDVAVVCIDKDSRLFYINMAYEKILGIEPAKILGRYMNIIEPNAMLLDTLASGEPHTIKNIHINSIDKYANTWTYPLKKGNEIIGAYSLFTDVTDVRTLNDQIERISAINQEYNSQLLAEAFLREHNIIGNSNAYLNCINRAIRVAETDAVVLIQGESGSGKEVIKNVIKANSARKNEPFITVNCSAIPESLFESELFGYEEGAFTGAVKGGKLGKFQLADGGTIFLDEIGDMPIHMQAKLLRVLQEKEIEKVGRQKTIPVNVRVITATNKNLEKMVEEGLFREDLYYRLKVITISVPPLRERENDVLELTNYYLNYYCDKYNLRKKLDQSVYRIFQQYDWPGNVRELQNLIESLVILSEGEVVTKKELPKSMTGNEEQSKPVLEDGLYQFDFGNICFADEMKRFEEEYLKKAIEYCDGDKKKTIAMLDMSPRTFYRKIANFGK